MNIFRAIWLIPVSVVYIRISIKITTRIIPWITYCNYMLSPKIIFKSIVWCSRHLGYQHFGPKSWFQLDVVPLEIVSDFTSIDSVLFRFITISIKSYPHVFQEQGKSEGFDSCDRPSNLKLDSNRQFFRPCDREIWRMTLQYNRAPLLCYFKLCASFRSHWWIQTSITVRKRPIWVKFDDF